MSSDRNFVAKYDWRVNKSKTFVDRKKEMKKGYKKHKKVLTTFYNIV